jgi:hypothetical protein
MTNDNSTYGAGGRPGMNPVGLIVLLVLLVYALVCLVLATASDLRDFDRSALIAFVVLFPILILLVFVRPLTRRLSAPVESAESLDETAFLAVMSPLLNAQLERSGNEASVVQAEETVAAVFAARRRLDSHAGVRRRILWLDDSPDTNVFERQAFERMGIQVDHSPSATGAQGHVQRDEYGAVVISERGDDHASTREGYALLDAMRSGGDHATPLFVYTDANGEDHRLEAMNRGAQDATNRPIALFDMVTRSLV